jgi:SAM-dependent methyltransferase
VSPSRKASNVLLREWGKDITGHVLSIGSGTDEDKQGGHYRDYFPKATSYITSEPEPSLHCDMVLDVRKLPEDMGNTFNAVLCSGVLEHVDDLFDAVFECRRVLVEGGLFLVGFPLNQPPHRMPQDFWRFTESAIRYLCDELFYVESLVPIGDPAYPTTYWVKARAI